MIPRRSSAERHSWSGHDARRSWAARSICSCSGAVRVSGFASITNSPSAAVGRRARATCVEDWDDSSPHRGLSTDAPPESPGPPGPGPATLEQAGVERFRLPHHAVEIEVAGAALLAGPAPTPGAGTILAHQADGGGQRLRIARGNEQA